MTRTEKDSMGEMPVPADALYGASTQRAVLNFPISGHRMPPAFLHGMAIIKRLAAQVNAELGLLTPVQAALIADAAREIEAGKWADQFPVDVFQTGSGTSTNMNVNEVIANRVSQMAGEEIGSKRPVHPNDDVNRGQSSNDVIPTALHVSLALSLQMRLKPALERLAGALAGKAHEFLGIVKIGRTHLMDATPLTLGQEFSGYAMQIGKAVERTDRAISVLCELALGDTAVGTGINTHPEFAGRVIALLAEETALPFRRARNPFEAQASRDDVAEAAGLIATIAGSLIKVANDIRLLGSGPRSGLGEITLKAVQPGSSIMPGKVNPVHCEALIQTALYAQGLASVAQSACREGYFELNTSLPLTAHTMHEAIRCLGNAVRIFAAECVEGIEANEDRCRELVNRSLMLVTALNPYIGYDAAASVAKEAHVSGRTLREVVLERGLMEPKTLDAALDPKGMIGLDGT